MVVLGVYMLGIYSRERNWIEIRVFLPTTKIADSPNLGGPVVMTGLLEKPNFSVGIPRKLRLSSSSSLSSQKTATA